MEQNVGSRDRVGRAIVAIFLLAYSLKKPGKLGTIAAFNAGMLISSVFSGYCPLCKLCGKNTADNASQSCCSECC